MPTPPHPPLHPSWRGYPPPRARSELLPLGGNRSSWNHVFYSASFSHLAVACPPCGVVGGGTRRPKRSMGVGVLQLVERWVCTLHPLAQPHKGGKKNAPPPPGGEVGHRWKISDHRMRGKTSLKTWLKKLRFPWGWGLETGSSWTTGVRIRATRFGQENNYSHFPKQFPRRLCPSFCLFPKGLVSFA